MNPRALAAALVLLAASTSVPAQQAVSPVVASVDPAFVSPTTPPAGNLLNLSVQAVQGPIRQLTVRLPAGLTPPIGSVNGQPLTNPIPGNDPLHPLPIHPLFWLGQDAQKPAGWLLTSINRTGAGETARFQFVYTNTSLQTGMGPGAFANFSYALAGWDRLAEGRFGVDVEPTASVRVPVSGPGLPPQLIDLPTHVLGGAAPDSIPTAGSFLVDGTPPNVTLVGAPAGDVWVSAVGALQLVGNDNKTDLSVEVAGVDRICFRSGASPVDPADCTSAAVVNLTSIAEGVTTLHFLAVDKAKNRGNETQASLKVDFTKPNLTLEVLPSVPGWYNLTTGPPTARVNATNPVKAHDQSPLVEACLVLDEVKDCVPNPVGPFERILAEGIHVLAATAKDEALNPALVENQTIQFDRTAPTVDLVLSVTDPATGWFTVPVHASATASDALSTIASRCAAFENNATCVPGGLNLLAGRHRVLARATDVAGNANVSAVRPVDVDLANPVPSIVPTGALEGLEGWFRAFPVQLSCTDDNVTGSGLASCAHALDADASSVPLPLTAGAGSVAANLDSVLPDGNHTLRLVATDVAGRSASVTRTYQLDRVPPTVVATIPLPGASNVASAMTLTALVSDDRSQVDTTSGRILLDGATLAATLTGGALTAAVTGLTTGVHTVIAEVKDKAGNLRNDTWTFNVGAGLPGNNTGNNTLPPLNVSAIALRAPVPASAVAGARQQVCWDVAGTGKAARTGLVTDSVSRANATNLSAYLGATLFPGSATTPAAAGYALPGGFCAEVTLPATGSLFLRAFVDGPTSPVLTSQTRIDAVAEVVRPSPAESFTGGSSGCCVSSGSTSTTTSTTTTTSSTSGAASATTADPTSSASSSTTTTSATTTTTAPPARPASRAAVSAEAFRDAVEVRASGVPAGGSADLHYRFAPEGGSFGAWKVLASAVAASATFTGPDGEGVYEFASLARDAAGLAEVKELAREAAARKDTTPPVVTLTGTPAPSSFPVSTAPRVRAAARDASAVTFEARVCAPLCGAFAPVRGDTVDVAQEGALRVEVQPRDAAGNVGAVESLAYVVDRTLPEAVFHALADGLTVRLDATGSLDASGIAAYAWTFDDGTRAEGAEVTHVFPAAGLRSITLEVRDLAGNTGRKTQVVDLGGDLLVPASTCLLRVEGTPQAGQPVRVVATGCPEDLAAAEVQVERNGQVVATVTMTRDGDRLTGQFTPPDQGTYALALEGEDGKATTAPVPVAVGAKRSPGPEAALLLLGILGLAVVLRRRRA